MKIVFFSESNMRGKVPRDFENARTEFGWSIALDSEWCQIGQAPTDKFDLGIVIIPKNNPNINIRTFRSYCDKVAVMQEGPHWYFQDYTIDKQFQYYNALILEKHDVAIILDQNNEEINKAKKYIYEIYNNKNKVKKIYDRIDKIKVKNPNSLIYSLIIDER